MKGYKLSNKPTPFEYVSDTHAWQDYFALELLGKNKRWLEIGANHPFKNGNNTALLELYGWSGISIEIDGKYKDAWKNSWRDDSVLEISDAITYDYSSLKDKHFNFIQLDCEPPSVTYTILEKVLNAGLTFDSMTFEHDLYSNPLVYMKIKNDAYDMISDYGYRRIYEDVPRSDMLRQVYSYEDWYVSQDIKYEINDWSTWAKSIKGKYAKGERRIV